MALIDKLKAIGDAIRTKTGSTNTYTLEAMPDAILAIKTGIDSGQLDIFTGTFTPASTGAPFVFSEHIGYATCNAIVGCYFYADKNNNGGGTRDPRDSDDYLNGVLNANSSGDCWRMSSDRKSLNSTSSTWFTAGKPYSYVLIRVKGMYVPNPTTVLSTLYVNGHSYNFDDGMTFKDWVESNYDPDSYGYSLYDDGTYLRYNNPDYKKVLAHSDGTPVLQTDRIMAGATYINVLNPKYA